MNFSWGKGLVIAYAVFMAGIAVMISISVSKDVDLVAPNYYEKEIKYQQEIDRINNTNKLPKRVEFVINGDILLINYPAGSTRSVITGEIIFYRPSDSKKDFSLKVEPGNDFIQDINIAFLEKGLWKIKLMWNMDGINYLDMNSFVKQ